MLRKFILSLMILLLPCGVSYADFIYTTTEGMLGTIWTNQSSDIELSSTHYNPGIPSPFLTSYWSGSNTKILLLDRYASDSGDKGYVFSPSNLGEISESHDIAGVFGTEHAGFSENGYSIFLTSGARIYDVSASAFSVKSSFDCSKVISRDGYDTEICDIAVDTIVIHVLAKAGDDLRYIRFDGQLKDDVKIFKSFDVSPGASVILGAANSAAFIGHSYGIDVLRRTGRSERVISTDYPVKAMCPDESNNLFYAEQRQSGDVYVNTIRHYAERSLFEEAEIVSSSPNIKLIRDNTRREVFAAMTDEKITVFVYTNYVTSKREFTASELEGTPAGITAATVTGYDPKSSSSSGCSSGYAGMIMLAVIPFMLKRK